MVGPYRAVVGSVCDVDPACDVDPTGGNAATSPNTVTARVFSVCVMASSVSFVLLLRQDSFTDYCQVGSKRNP